MSLISQNWQRRLIGAACAAVLAGCSSSKPALTQSSASPMPDRQVTLTPGAADRGDQAELRNPAKMHVAYARWQEQQKKLPQARESYQKALTHDPKSVDALLGLSRLDQLAGRYADAEQKLERAETLQPKSGLVSAAWGEHHASQQQWDAAIARYEQAVDRDATETLYRHQLAVMLAKAGRTADAVAAFTPLVGEAEAHYNVGYVLHQQGQTLAAEEQFQRALALKPEFPVAARMLARSRRERGVPDASHQVMTAAVSTAPFNPPLSEAPASSSVAWRAHDGITPASATSAVPQPPEGLSPQQLEQWYNQRAAGR